jgi:hypothetical protein
LQALLLAICSHGLRYFQPASLSLSNRPENGVRHMTTRIIPEEFQDPIGSRGRSAIPSFHCDPDRRSTSGQPCVWCHCAKGRGTRAAGLSNRSPGSRWGWPRMR